MTENRASLIEDGFGSMGARPVPDRNGLQADLREAVFTHLWVGCG